MPHNKIFEGLVYESKEREYWAEDDKRLGTAYTTRIGFWILAFFGRIRDLICWLLYLNPKHWTPTYIPKWKRNHAD